MSELTHLIDLASARLGGKALARIRFGSRTDGTPDRAKAEWIVRGPAGRPGRPVRGGVNSSPNTANRASG